MIRAAVTGTNGKSSTAWMLASIFEAAGLPTAAVTGLGLRWTHASLGDLPPSMDLAGLAARVESVGGQALVQEVTSRALAQGWHERLPTDLAIYTNLAADHHEFHGSADAYAEAKAQLFVTLHAGASAVLDLADPRMRALTQRLDAGVEVLAFNAPPDDDTPGYRVVTAQPDVEGTSVELRAHGGVAPLGRVRIPHVGAMFGDNAAAAATAATACNIPPAAIAGGLAAAPVPPGRFELITTEPTTVVDFSHNEAALRRALETARALAGDGRVLVVFGAGGDRMVEKRGPMGRVAAQLADAAWITNDNPRSEDPSRIAGAIVEGWVAVRSEPPVVELHRPSAIARAVEAAAAHDVVLIAGMGADRYSPRESDPDTTDIDELLALC